MKKHAKAIYIFFILLLLMSLSACNNGDATDDNDDSLLDVIEKTLGYKDDLPIDKDIIEEQLRKQFNNTLFYTDPDDSYIHHFIGHEVDYIVTGSMDTMTDEYPDFDGVSHHFSVILSPNFTDLHTAYTGMSLHIEETNDSTKKYWWDLPTYFQYYEDYYNYNFLTLDSLEDLEGEADFAFLFGLDNQKRWGRKVYYRGTIFIDEPQMPEVDDFPEKEAIISEIFKWIEEENFLDHYTEDDKVIAYIKDFDKNSTETTIFLVPWRGIRQSAIIRYNLFREHKDGGRLNSFVHYRSRIGYVPPISKENVYIAEMVIEFPVAIKEY
ncbi:hypothetical protein EDC18_101435 [Natranaerovirga pectinivora]|uniref:Uncharacterized protein n=1 Tax=Natranaerovirga pectinivora TaxID=682400 RepID=A0A4R3MPB2_9FIRM|nr:hypothetical protein [Natranaerovirga pectinivora]TCT17137.1 hypothetical protein EDC18_101435 [Natranaerovirga pectinivora]